ncbi:MAG: hypothetical protein DSY80_10485, partial [Desulfocapsa sp.]
MVFSINLQRQYTVIEKTFRIKSVQGNVYALLGIALLSIIGLIVVNILIVRTMHHEQQSIAHEQTKIELNTMLHTRLLRLRTELQSISMNRKPREIAFHRKNAAALTVQLEDIIKVLEKGGTLENRYQINFANKEETTQTLYYQKKASAAMDLALLELKSHLGELAGLTATLDQIITARSRAVAEGNRGQQERLDKKIQFFYKGIEPFFNRILENANRISFESSKNLELLEKIRYSAIRRYVLLVWVLAGSGLLLLFLAGRILVNNIKKIVQERISALTQLRETNEHLEETVTERTRALSQSIEQLAVEIEERKTAQKELRQRSTFLQNTIEALAHPFYVIDVSDYSILLHNSAAKILGNPEDTHCYQLTHQRDTPCDGHDHPCPLREVLNTGKPCILDHVHFDKDGNEVFVEVHGYPICDDEGNIIQMIEYSLDVTARKNAEHALVKANEDLEARVEERTRALQEEVQDRRKAEREMEKTARHFRFLIEHAPGVVMIINTGGFIEYVSPSIETMTGYTVETFVHKSLISFTHEDDDEHLDFMWKMVPGGNEKISREFRFMTNDGNWIIVDSVTVNRLDEPSIGGIVMNAWDVTERKQLEMKMRWLSQAVEQSPNTVVITDTSGTITYVNKSFVKTTGYTSEEALGKNPRILKSGKTPPEVYKDMWQTITSGHAWTGEFINKKKNGELYTEQVIISPLRNERGEVTSYLATKENVTELIKARRQAEEANRAKSAFLANMSHEIRTPLNGIVGFVDLLSKKERDAGQKKYIDIIKASADHLQSIIDDILDLSKIESGKLELDLRKTRLRKKLEPAIELFYAKAAEKNVDFFSFIDATLPECLSCDVLRINQVMANLINNAIKFTDNGGRVDVIVKKEETRGETVRVTFSVKDTGIGLDEAAQKKIFQSFSQADVATTRKYGGTGLGLTISKTLVEMMGGRLLLESKPGQGSTFYFTLELAICGQDVADQEKTACREQVRSIAVLVTDHNDRSDEEHIMTYLESMAIATTFVSMQDDPADYDLIIAVVQSLTDNELGKLYREYRRKLILVIPPENLQDIEEQYPGVKTINKPLNPSKIYDAVACIFGHKESVHSASEDELLESFTGSRLLVAEDNTINQTLISVLLKDLNIEFDLANNGLEALEQFKTASYDLVLMDVNMPEMDGITATGEIIAYEQENNLAHVPIVALTAHALKGDRQKMLDAGMDNYLAKPIDRKKLLSILAHYLGAPESLESGESLYQGSYNLEKVAASLGIRNEQLKKMLEQLAGQIESALEEVPALIETGAWEKMQNLAHSLSGVAANFRLVALAECAR